MTPGYWLRVIKRPIPNCTTALAQEDHTDQCHVKRNRDSELLWYTARRFWLGCSPDIKESALPCITVGSSTLAFSNNWESSFFIFLETINWLGGERFQGHEQLAPFCLTMENKSVLYHNLRISPCPTRENFPPNKPPTQNISSKCLFCIIHL